MSAADLVRESGVSLATIHRAESVDGQTTMTLANAFAIRRALENAGVEFIEENGGGSGARLKQRLKQHSGSIDVDTPPGLFTEFKIVLPRTNQG